MPLATPNCAPVGIVAALAAEARQLGPATRRAGSFTLLAGGTRLAVTGIGLAAAAEGARLLAAAGCGALASWGLAGGLDPSLTPGAIVLPREIAFEDSTSLSTADDWRGTLARSLEMAGQRTAKGKLLTSRKALETVAAKASAFRQTGADAVDMESFAVAEVAHARGLPFIAVRAIIDGASDEVPPSLTAASDARGRLLIVRLLARLAAHPADVMALFGLAARYRAAARSLRSVAATTALTAPPV